MDSVVTAGKDLLVADGLSDGTCARQACMLVATTPGCTYGTEPRTKVTLCVSEQDAQTRFTLGVT